MFQGDGQMTWVIEVALCQLFRKSSQVHPRAGENQSSLCTPDDLKGTFGCDWQLLLVEISSKLNFLTNFISQSSSMV